MSLLAVLPRRGYSLLAAAVLVASPVFAQAQKAAPKTGSAGAAKTWTKRTPDGQPDLQGVWDYATITPFERPKQVGDKAFLSEQEAAEFEKKTAELENRDRRDGLGSRVTGSDGRSDVARAYNEFWWDKGTKVVATNRTSLIVDPPDGRVPPRTKEGQERDVRSGAVANRFGVAPGAEISEDSPDGGPADSWEDRSLWERCITRNLPALPGAYNNNIQIIQSAGHVVILNEMIHEARVIPLDGQPHIKVGQWHGNSRGHFEGDTLVVDTVGFTDATNFRGSGKGLHLVERYRRVDADTLFYEFTADDPSTWTRSWTAQVPMTKNQGAMYEYACHECNYGLPGLLAGARALERNKAAGGASKKGSK
jgi:hypothetical protein